MEYLRKLFLSCLICIIMINVVYGLTPTIFATKEGILGPSDVQLKCIYTKTATEKVFSIAIQAEISSEFKPIASFFPPDQNLNATLTGEGQTLLSNRVTLTNPAGTPSNGQYETVMTYNETTCEDEKWYRCQVTYTTGSVTSSSYSQNTTIVVKGKPSAPDSPPTFVPPSGIEEGMTVNFTCTGNVGKPAGKFFWTKFRGSTPYPQSAVTTTAQVVQGTCTSNGTSILSVQVQAEDNNAVFRCTVEQELAESNMYQQTQPDDFNVYYKVRNIVASKPAGAPPSYAEGAPPITLTCSAEGNPPLAPNDYTWYNETDMETPLGTGTTYTIQNVIVNQTGNYVCVGRNSFNGKNYNASATVHIQIDYTTTPAPTTTPSVTSDSGVSKGPQTDDESEGLGTGAIAGIAVGCLLAVVVIIVIIIFVIKPCRDKDTESGANTSGSSTGKPINNLGTLEKSPYDQNNFGGKNGSYNSQLQYADLNFDYDDRPRSRKPINLSMDSDLNHTPYAEVMMPRV